MDERPIDVVMPGAEGEWLVRALGDAGLVARRRHPGSAPREPAPRLLVVGVGPEEEARALFTELRAGASPEALPIVVVGGSQVGLHWAQELGVVSFVHRPVTISRLVEEVRSVDVSGIAPASMGSAVISARRLSSIPESASPRVHDTVVTIPPDGRAIQAAADPRFSERLRALFARADQQLFPDRPALEISLKDPRIGVELTAAELVPDEVLASRRDVDDDDEDGDALEYLPGEATFVGGAPAIGSTTSVGMRSGHEVGSVLEGRIVELLHGLATASGARNLALELPGGRRFELTIAEGRIARFDGPVALELWSRLRDEVALEGDAPEDELAAQSILEAECEAGRLDRYELERGLRLGRESLLYRAMAAPALRYRLGPADRVIGAESRLLGPDLIPLLFEGMRRGVRAPDAVRWLGGGDRSILLTPETRHRLTEAEIEPELFSYLERVEGAALADAIEGLDPRAGLAGLLVALHRSSALDIGPAVALRGAGAPRSLRSRLVERHRRALDGDYFSLLGLSRDASDREVEAAYRAGRADLESLRVERDADPDLERLRDECLEALSEAFEVLQRGSLREAYAAALA